MTTKRLVAALAVVLVGFMAATVAIAFSQDDVDWGWWWAVPLGGFFVLVIIIFRLLVQRSQEAAERADRKADEPSR